MRRQDALLQIVFMLREKTIEGFGTLQRAIQPLRLNEAYLETDNVKAKAPMEKAGQATPGLESRRSRMVNFGHEHKAAATYEFCQRFQVGKVVIGCTRRADGDAALRQIASEVIAGSAPGRDREPREYGDQDD
jgi:hypothetical protein